MHIIYLVGIKVHNEEHIYILYFSNLIHYITGLMGLHLMSEAKLF